MLVRPGGFSAFEILLVLVIMVLLSSIVFPIFAEARERERQTTCLDQQRQISTAILTWAQDHADTLPATDIWSAVNLSPATLICPAAPSLRNGYVYSNTIAGVRLAILRDRRTALLIADGEHTAMTDEATVYNTTRENVAYGADDLRYRHARRVTVAFADGHVDTTDDPRDLSVEFRPGAAAEFTGYDTATGGLWYTPHAKFKFGAHGYVLPDWNNNAPAIIGLDESYVASVTTATATGLTWVTEPCSDVRAVANPQAGGLQAAACWVNDGTYTVTLRNPNDAAIHTMHIYSVDWDRRQRVMYFSLRGADDTVLTKQAVPLSEFSGGVWLTFRFRGNIVIEATHTDGPNAVVSAFVFD